MIGHLDIDNDDAECGYCGDMDGASVMAVDPYGEVSCWRCARDNGFFSSDEVGDDDWDDSLMFDDFEDEVEQL